MDTRGNQLKHKTDAMAAGGTSQPIANCQHRIVSLGRSSPFVRYAWCAQCQCIQRHRPWPGVMTKSVEIGFRMEFSQQTHGCGISTGARKCANYYTTLYGCCRLVGSDVRPLSSSSSSSSSGHRIGSSYGCWGVPPNCELSTTRFWLHDSSSDLSSWSSLFSGVGIVIIIIVAGLLP